MVTEIQHLQNDVVVWSESVFGPGSRLMGILNHLKLEVNELIETPTDPYEFADCLILLLEAAHHAGLNTDDLITTSYRKLEINKKRKWGTPNPDGSVEHIEEG